MIQDMSSPGSATFLETRYALLPPGLAMDTITALMDASAIGGRLRAARKAAGLRQQDVAKELGIARTAIISWEKGASEGSMVSLARMLALYRDRSGGAAVTDPAHVLFGEGRRLPVGAMLLDRRLVDALLSAKTADDIRRLEEHVQMNPRMFVCAAEIPEGAEIVTAAEGDRVSDEAEGRARELAPELAAEWARVLRAKLGGAL